MSSFEFLAELDEIYTGAQAGAANRWSAVNYFDKVVLAQASVNAIYWPGGGVARELPGLNPDDVWDGVAAMANHLLLWKGDRLKWNDVDDFSNWIPVGNTSTSVVATLASSFDQPEVGDTTDWVYFTEPDLVFAVDQFVRVTLNENDPTTAIYNFYSIGAVAAAAGLDATTIDTAQSFSHLAHGRIYTQTQVDFPVGSRLIVNGISRDLVVTKDAFNPKAPDTLTTSAPSSPVPPAGGAITVQLSTNPTGLKVGDAVSIGPAGVGADIYTITHVGFTLQATRDNQGTERQATGYVFPTGTTITMQPFIGVDYQSGVTPLSFPASSDITAQSAVKLQGLGLTGESLPGDVIEAGNVLFTVDANEAGEDVNAGAGYNGDIFTVVPLSEYGSILKRHSIQTIQYVGQGFGTFFIRGEIADVGPIARNAWGRFDSASFVFLGDSELYQYSGGQNLIPIATTVTKEVFAELDRSRADEIVFYHNKVQDQIWMVYPSLKTPNTRVLIYNYREQSSVIDDYDASLHGITAIGAVDWEVAPTWRSLSNTQFWNTETKRWREYVEDGQQRYTVIAVGGDLPALGEFGEEGEDGIPRLLLHGRKYSRASGDNCEPKPYLVVAETIDYDFKDSTRLKYVDTVIVNLDVRTALDRPKEFYIQIGCRDNLDSDLRWTVPARLEPSGNGMAKTKVNIRNHGRFARVRFFSEEVDIQWRVAGFELIARAGGTY